MGNPVIHFEIGAAESERAQRFYAQLFGWDIAADATGYELVNTGSEIGIGGGIVQAPPGVGSWVTFYVGVEDLEKSLARAEELGGRRVVGPTPVGEMGSFATFTDLDGNMVGLFTER